MGIVTRLLGLRRVPGMERIVRETLYVWGCDIPPEVVIGRNVHIEHRGIGTVIHPNVTIDDDAVIYHGVTIGQRFKDGPTGRALIGKGATISTGAVILIPPQGITIGEGAVIGANAVITRDVPAGETWVGIPARKVAS